MEGNYMTSGWNNKGYMVANKVDHIVDKISFVSDMLENNLLALDAIEGELQTLSRGNTPPTPQVLATMATRIDSIQAQIRHGLTKMKELSREVDLATDALQGSGAGWR